MIFGADYKSILELHANVFGHLFIPFFCNDKALGHACEQRFVYDGAEVAVLLSDADHDVVLFEPECHVGLEVVGADVAVFEAALIVGHLKVDTGVHDVGAGLLEVGLQVVHVVVEVAVLAFELGEF